MQVSLFPLCVVFSTFSLVFSGKNFFQVQSCCTFDGPGSKDMVYTLMYYMNKRLMMQYNSTRGNWTGFTDFAVQQAQLYNSDPYDAALRIFQKQLLSIDSKVFIEDAKNVISAPTVKLTRVRQPSVLVCSAYDFYPKQIKVTWLRNGQEAVYATEAMSDGDWYYQVHSYLEYTPTPGEKITCVVEHASLREPLLQVWDPSLPKSQRIKIAVGTLFLVLGLIFLSSGFIYYKKKSAAHVVLCQGRELIPVEIIPEAGPT